ncbi:BQ2448_3261 [Microbotryum intermedium]|uniref:BQ2448_3261 protein n=1 Tax=Microbotryum intermedium TaxID=269621 RepID=A0A238FI44_9BASI|nr:BQ2448_3261 [Microbotryum intermedium]
MHSTLAFVLLAAPLGLASAIQQRAVTDQQFQAAQGESKAALQGFLANATTALTNGNCTTPCGPYVTALQNCVTTSGSNLTAIGVCACQSSTLTQMATCGGCINGDSAVQQFGEVCKELNGEDTSNSTSSSSAAAGSATSSVAAASATSGGVVASATSRAASATSAAAAAATSSKAASSGAKSYVKGGVVVVLASVAILLVL